MHSQNCVVTLLQSWLICSTECPMVWVQTRIPTLISPLIQSGKLWGTWGKTQNLTPFTQCMFIFRNSCNLWYIIKSYDSCNRSMSIKLSLCSPTVGLTDCPLIWNMMEVTVDPVCSCVCVCGHQLVEPYRHLERSFRLVRPLARATSSSPIMMQGMLPPPHPPPTIHPSPCNNTTRVSLPQHEGLDEGAGGWIHAQSCLEQGSDTERLKVGSPLLQPG